MTRTILFATLATVTCSPTPTPAPEPEPPPARADCFDAQKVLEKLDCRREDGSAWAATPAGTPFGVACERAASDGRDWHPECIGRITDCSQLEAAYEGRWCP